MSLSDESAVGMADGRQHRLLGPSVRLALSNLLCFADSGSMEQDALCAPMTMGVKKPRAF